MKRDVEPAEVRRFLRQELLKKVGHSWWNKPRLYRHDLAEEWEPTPPVQSVVVIPSDPDQPEVSPERQEPGPSGPSKGIALDEPAASPVTSLPRTLGQDILLPGNSEESPRSREGRMAAATLEQEMGRRSMAEAIRPIKDWAVASSSSAAGPVTERMVAEACDTLIREKHPASQPPHLKTPGLWLRVTRVGREGLKSSRSLLPLDGRRRQHQDQREAGPQRDVEPAEVRRFLRQELLKKVGHSWWNKPRLYRHDLAEEWEPTPPVQSVVVIPSDPDQPEASPERQEPGPSGPSKGIVLGEPAASPVTSLPRTLGRDILLPGDSEESPRPREGRMAAATLEQEMGRRSVAEAIRPIKDWAVASLSSAAGPVTEGMVAEACDTLIREKHPASQPPHLKTPGLRLRVTRVGREGLKSYRSLLPLNGRRRQHQDQREAGPQRECNRGRFKPCSVRALSSGKKNHRPYTRTSPRPRSLGAMEAMSQRTSEAGGRSDTTQWHGPLPTRMGTRKERGHSRRKPWELNLLPT